MQFRSNVLLNRSLHQFVFGVFPMCFGWQVPRITFAPLLHHFCITFFEPHITFASHLHHFCISFFEPDIISASFFGGAHPAITAPFYLPPSGAGLFLGPYWVDMQEVRGRMRRVCWIPFCGLPGISHGLVRNGFRSESVSYPGWG